MKKLLSYLGEYKKYAILTPLVMVGETIMEVMIPFIMSIIIDRGVANGTLYIVQTGIFMVIVSFISLFFGYMGGKFAATAATGFAKNLRRELFSKVQEFSFNNTDKFSTSSLITRITTDVNNIQGAFMMALRILVRTPLMLIGASIMAIITSAKLSLIFIFVTPIFIIIVMPITYFTALRFRAVLKQIDLLNLNVQENLMGVRVVKSFVREEHENEKFEKTANELRDLSFSAEKLITNVYPLLQFMIYCCIISIVWFGGRFVIENKINIGQMASFVTYTFQILMSVRMLAAVLLMILLSKASADRIVEIINEEIDIKNEKDMQLSLIDGSIEYKNVNFSYNNDKNNLILANINLKVGSGETLGVIGSTASGKSTLVQLLPRLYDVLDGSVMVGQHDVKDYDLKTLRDEIAMVLQKNILFSGTIRENLLWGNENATEDEIIRACQNAQAYEFIQTLPEGLDTALERGATNLSGGQKQRLCIARALLKNPKILILDDSTSAVDTTTDGRIREVFREKLSNMTKIIISQRILSIKDADNIIVIDNGRISGVGNHKYLLENNEIYKEIYYSQQESLGE